MRLVHCLSFISLFSVAACTDATGSTVIDGGQEAGPTCTSGVSDEILHLATATSSREAVATGEGTAGVAFSDATGALNIGLVAPDGTTSAHVLSNPIPRSHYKDYSVGLAYAQGRFALTFDFERTTSANVTSPDGWASVGFTSIDATTGTPSAIEMANNDIDRTGSDGGDPVQAWGGVAIPTKSGFFVEWSDMRTAEPIQYGVNLAGWTGMYGFGFALDGDLGMNEDVQVMQQDAPFGYAGVSTSKGILAAWGGRDANATEAWLYTRLGPASGQFTPGPTSSPIVKVPGAIGRALTAARGADGNVLLAFEVGSLTGVGSIVTVVVDSSGNLVSKHTLAQSANRSYGMSAIAATSAGYAVAYASQSTSSTKASFDTIHLASLDATGAPTGATEDTPIDGAPLQGNLAVAADDTGRVVVYFVSGTTPSLSLRSLTACPSP